MYVIVVIKFVTGAAPAAWSSPGPAPPCAPPLTPKSQPLIHIIFLWNQYESSHVCYNLKYFINVD